MFETLFTELILHEADLNLPLLHVFILYKTLVYNKVFPVLENSLPSVSYMVKKLEFVKMPKKALNLMHHLGKAVFFLSFTKLK